VKKGPRDGSEDERTPADEPKRGDAHTRDDEGQPHAGAESDRASIEGAGGAQEGPADALGGQRTGGAGTPDPDAGADRRRKDRIVLVLAAFAVLSVALLPAIFDVFRDPLPLALLVLGAALLVTVGQSQLGLVALPQSANSFLLVVGVLATVAAAVVAVVAVGAGGDDDDDDRGPRLGADACLRPGESERQFHGTTTLPNVPVRQGPGLRFTPIGKPLPLGCNLNFIEVCIGDEVDDYATHRSGTPDVQWFKLADGPGYVASARIKGNPPEGKVPEACPGGKHPPGPVRLVRPRPDRVKGTVSLAARITNTPIVGFAVYNGREWKQIEWDDEPDGVAEVEWDSRDLRGPVTVAAVACLASGVPYDAQDLRNYVVGAGKPSDGIPPDAATLARTQACSLPRRLR